MRQGAKPFASTSFYAQIANLYRDGAGLVIAADLDRIVMQSLRKEKDAAAAQQLGVTDLRYFIVEIKEKDGRPYNRAVVSFRENQRRSEEHTSELQSRPHLVCRLLLEK